MKRPPSPAPPPLAPPREVTSNPGYATTESRPTHTPPPATHQPWGADAMWRSSCVPAPLRRPQLWPPGGARPDAPGTAGLWGQTAGEGPGLRGWKEEVSSCPSLGEPPCSSTSEDPKCSSRPLEPPDHSLDSSAGPSQLPRPPAIAGMPADPRPIRSRYPWRELADRNISGHVPAPWDYFWRSPTAPS